MKNCYSISRSCIDENNVHVSRSCKKVAKSQILRDRSYVIETIAKIRYRGALQRRCRKTRMAEVLARQAVGQVF